MRARVAALIITLAAALAPAAAAVAQEFQKVEGGTKDEVPAVPFVALAYGFIWIAVLVYVFVVARGLGRVRGEIDEVRRKIERADDQRRM